MPIQIPTTQLSFGTRGDDVAQVQRALQTLGKSVPPAEAADRVLGNGTVALLKALQADLALPATGIVDAATIKAINAKLASLKTDPRVIRGVVRDIQGNPFSNGFVQIFSQGPNGEQAIGKSTPGAKDGAYTISYPPPPTGTGRTDLRVAVLNTAGLMESTPSGASILTDAGPLEVINFVVVGPSLNQPLSEFELLLSDLSPLLGTRKLQDLIEHDISLLAIQSGFSSEQIAHLAIALKLEAAGKTPAPVFYGLLQQGLPADGLALHAADPAVRLKALKTALAQGAVPKEVGGKKIEDFLPDLVSSPTKELDSLLSPLLNPSELNAFVGRFAGSSQDPETFWKGIAADPALAGRAPELKLIVQLGVLTNSHAPLVDAIRALPTIKEASDVASLTEDQWKSLIQAPGVGVPTETPGATAEEKTQNYVRQIMAQVEAAFPTRFLAERLGAAPVATFLKGQPTYDLRTTYPAQFFKKNPAAAHALTPEDGDHLRSMQRIYRLTNSAKETIGLTQKGVRSARQIARPVW